MYIFLSLQHDGGGGVVELFPYNMSGGRACFEVLGNLCVSDISTLTEILGSPNSK